MLLPPGLRSQWHLLGETRPTEPPPRSPAAAAAPLRRKEKPRRKGERPQCLRAQRGLGARTQAWQEGSQGAGSRGPSRKREPGRGTPVLCSNNRGVPLSETELVRGPWPGARGGTEAPGEPGLQVCAWPWEAAGGPERRRGGGQGPGQTPSQAPGSRLSRNCERERLGPRPAIQPAARPGGRAGKAQAGEEDEEERPRGGSTGSGGRAHGPRAAQEARRKQDPSEAVCLGEEGGMERGGVGGGGVEEGGRGRGSVNAPSRAGPSCRAWPRAPPGLQAGWLPGGENSISPHASPCGAAEGSGGLGGGGTGRGVSPGEDLGDLDAQYIRARSSMCSVSFLFMKMPASEQLVLAFWSNFFSPLLLDEPSCFNIVFKCGSHTVEFVLISDVRRSDSADICVPHCPPHRGQRPPATARTAP